VLRRWVSPDGGNRRGNIHQLLTRGDRSVDEPERLAIMDANTDLETDTIGIRWIVHDSTDLEAENFAREHAVFAHDIDAAVGDQRCEALV
jgi:hypothetical protein